MWRLLRYGVVLFVVVHYLEGAVLAGAKGFLLLLSTELLQRDLRGVRCAGNVRAALLAATNEVRLVLRQLLQQRLDIRRFSGVIKRYRAHVDEAIGIGGIREVQFRRHRTNLCADDARICGLLGVVPLTFRLVGTCFLCLSKLLILALLLCLLLGGFALGFLSCRIGLTLKGLLLPE